MPGVDLERAPPPEEPTPTAVDRAQNTRLDKAFVYSVVALVVSVLGTMVAVADAYFTRDQARTLREQQEIILEQRAASAWPLIQWRPASDYSDPAAVEITFDVTNKGLGPAIIGAVAYRVGEYRIAGTQFVDDTLAHVRKGPPLRTWQNATLDSVVVSPGETIRLLTYRIDRSEDLRADWASVRAYVEWLKGAIRPEFCYCSVYGRCWAFAGAPQPPRSTACEAALSGVR